MEISCATNAVNLLIFVCSRARAIHNISHENRINARAMVAASCVVRLRRVSTFTPMTDVVRGKIAVGGCTRVVLVGR